MLSTAAATNSFPGSDIDGEKVYTNIDMDAQKRLYDIANTSQYVNYPNNGKQTFQLGVSVVDSYTGKV
ncbi:MAG: hypothetical protein ACTMH7_04520, partial [Leuconostoc fallax]